MNGQLVVHGQPSHGAIDQLINIDAKFQHNLTIDILTNTGFATQMSLLRDLAIWSTDAYYRHMYLVNGQVALCGGQQKGQSLWDGYREQVHWTFCDLVGSCLLPYFGLFHAALIAILHENRWYLDAADAYETQAIYRPTSKANSTGKANSAHITKAWHAASKGTVKATLSIVDKWYINMGIHIKLFPDMLRDHDSKAEDALTLQGDHRKNLMRNQYVNDGAVIGHLVSVEQDDFM
jgi:hypothetical protein